MTKLTKLDFWLAARLALFMSSSSNYQYLPAQKIKDFLHQKLSIIHSGRVSPATLDSISVEVYGTKLSVKELATITVPEPAQLLVTPFDKSTLVAIEKAIRESNLGVNPINNGVGLRLVFPPLTEEVRKSRLKEVKKLLEEAKIYLRQERQELLKHKKREKEEGFFSEDEFKQFEKELQEEVDLLNQELETIAKQKEEEFIKF